MMMKNKTKSAPTGGEKFEKQIDGFKKLWREQAGGGLDYLDDIPNFTGKDEPVPFPYGSGKGKDFGGWIHRPQRDSVHGN